MHQLIKHNEEVIRELCIRYRVKSLRNPYFIQSINKTKTKIYEA